MSCCAHRGVDPRPLGRSCAVVSVPLSHGHVYVVASTASKTRRCCVTCGNVNLTRSLTRSSAVLRAVLPVRAAGFPADVISAAKRTEYYRVSSDLSLRDTSRQAGRRIRR